MTCVRVAAVGDVHVGLDSDAVLAPESLAETADVLLVAGDLTRHGTPAEARCSPPRWRRCPSRWSSCSATTTTRATPPMRCAP